MAFLWFPVVASSTHELLELFFTLDPDEVILALEARIGDNQPSDDVDGDVVQAKLKLRKEQQTCNTNLPHC